MVFTFVLKKNLNTMTNSAFSISKRKDLKNHPPTNQSGNNLAVIATFWINVKKLVVPLVAAIWIRPGETKVDIRTAEDPIASYLGARSLYLESQGPF